MFNQSFKNRKSQILTICPILSGPGSWNVYFFLAAAFYIFETYYLSQNLVLLSQMI